MFNITSMILLLTISFPGGAEEPDLLLEVPCFDYLCIPEDPLQMQSRKIFCSSLLQVYHYTWRAGF